MRDHRQQPDGRLEARAVRPRSAPSSAGSAGALGPAEIKRLQRLAGNSAVTFVLQRDKGSPTPAPAAPPKAPPQPTDEERAVALQKELQPIFKKIFGKYGATEHFAPRSIKIVPDKQNEASIKALNVEADDQLRRLTKMAPEAVLKALQHLYKVEDKAWPPKAYAGPDSGPGLARVRQPGRRWHLLGEGEDDAHKAFQRERRLPDP